jgi:uncharacterized protein YdcH (DUF465 family)
MAKTVTLTVKVNDQEFKDFVDKYNKFVDNIKDLNNKFMGLSRTVTNVAQQTQKMTDNIKGLLNSLKHVHGVATNITKTFGKWATLIQGVVMALGAGVGMFGMDRLARAMTDRRRLQLGFGGDVAQTQATIRAGGILGDDTESILTNIRAAQADPKRARALVSLGLIDPSRPQAKKPEEIFEALVKKMPEFMKDPYALQKAQIIGLGDLASERWMMQFQGEKGQRASQQVIKQMKDKPADISPDALEAWTDTAQAWKNFATNVVNRLGEKFVNVAKFLTDLSKSLTELLNDFVAWHSFQDVFDGLKKWSERFARWIYGDKIVDDIKTFFGKFLDFLKDPNWTSFKTLFNSLITVLGDIVARIKDTVIDTIKNVLKAGLKTLLPQTLQDWLKGRKGGDGTDQHPESNMPPPSTQPVPGGTTPFPGGGSWSTSPPAAAPMTDPMSGGAMPGTPPPAGAPPATGGTPPAGNPPAPAPSPVPPGADRASTGGNQFASFMGGAGGGFTNQVMSFGGNRSVGFGGGASTSVGGTSIGLRGNNLFGGGTALASLRGGNMAFGGRNAMFRGGSSGASVGAASLALRGDTFGGRSRFASLRGGDRNLSLRGGSRFASFRGGGDMFASLARGGDTNIGGDRTSWARTAQAAVPGPGTRGAAFRGGSTRTGVGGGQRGRGGLDIDNWQLDRTASLRIDNNPGANAYMTGVSMG